MTLEEILSLDKLGKKILIIGSPGAGKTWLAKQLDPSELDTVHTDDYQHYSAAAAYEAILEDSFMRLGKVCSIVEGCFGYQMLLTGALDKQYRPDIIIQCVISPKKQRLVYLNERAPEKLRWLKHFEMVNQAKLNEYHKLVPEEDKPLWIKLENNYAVKNPY